MPCGPVLFANIATSQAVCHAPSRAASALRPPRPEAERLLGLCLSPTRTARAALLGRWAWSTTVEMPELGAAVALAAAAADVTAAVAAAPTVAWQAPIFGSGWQLEESEEPCGAARLHEHVHLTSRAAARPEPTRGAAHSTAAARLLLRLLPTRARVASTLATAVSYVQKYVQKGLYVARRCERGG